MTSSQEPKPDSDAPVSDEKASSSDARGQSSLGIRIDSATAVGLLGGYVLVGWQAQIGRRDPLSWIAFVFLGLGAAFAWVAFVRPTDRLRPFLSRRAALLWVLAPGLLYSFSLGRVGEADVSPFASQPAVETGVSTTATAETQPATSLSITQDSSSVPPEPRDDGESDARPRLYEASQLFTGAYVNAIAIGEGVVWLGAQTGVARYSPDNLDYLGEVAIERYSLGGHLALALGAGSVWWPTYDDTVARIDPVLMEVTADVSVPGYGYVSYGAGALWGAVEASNIVYRIDPGSNSIDLSVSVVAPSHLAASDDAIWVASEDSDMVHRIGPRGGELVVSIPVAGPTYVNAAPEAVWVASRDNDVVHRIDPRRNAVVASVTVPDEPCVIAADSQGVWVGTCSGERVFRIDPDENAIVDTVFIPVGPPCGIAIGFGAVWVAPCGYNTVYRIDLDGGV